MVFGVGVGWMREEFAAAGEEFQTRGKRTDEIIELLRKLWAGGMVEHHGRFYHLGPLQISPAPPGAVPIWVGGETEPALRRAAQRGDGWISMRHTVEEFRGFIGYLDGLRREAGREREPFEYMATLSEPVTWDAVRRLEEMGVHHLIGRRWLEFGSLNTLEAKEWALERHAEEVLRLG